MNNSKLIAIYTGADDGNNIWFIDPEHKAVLYIEKDACMVRFASVCPFIDSNVFNSLCFYAEGFLYFVSEENCMICRWNTKSEEYDFIRVDKKRLGSDKFEICSFYRYGDRLYIFADTDGLSVISVNLKNCEIRYEEWFSEIFLKEKLRLWRSSGKRVAGKNGNVFFLPGIGNALINYDIDKKRAEVIRINDIGNLAGEIIADGGYYWIVARGTEGIIRYDPRNMEHIIYNNYPKSMNVRVSDLCAPFTSVSFHGKILYCIPAYADTLIELNTETGEMKDDYRISNYADEGLNERGLQSYTYIYEFSDRIYACPFGADKMLEIDPKGTFVIERDFGIGASEVLRYEEAMCELKIKSNEPVNDREVTMEGFLKVVNYYRSQASAEAVCFNGGEIWTYVRDQTGKQYE